ncbi:hypothetical protein KQI65_00230 [bacterium]|nr:hypothetical protein [bacterium]
MPCAEAQNGSRLIHLWSRFEWPVGVLLLLILLRPVIDMTWKWKNYAIGVSPLQVVGVLLPLFLLVAMWTRRGLLDGIAKRHAEVVAWLILCLFSGLAMLVDSPGTESLGILIKFILPGLLLFFGFLLLREREMFDHIALMFVLAALFPLMFVCFEIFVQPISTSVRSGVVRFVGPYAQVSVYGFYFSMGYLGAGYLVLKRGSWRWFTIVCIFVLVFGISTPWVVHVTTWVVLASLTVALLIGMLWQRLWLKSAILLLIAVCAPIAAFLLRPDPNYEKVLGPDFAILRGDAPIEHLGNSRGYIWEAFLKQYAGLPLHAKLLGVPFAVDESTIGTGFGAHNDFLRILLMSGAVGLLLYLLWLGRTIWVVWKLRGEWRFLGMGALIIWLGFSAGLTPTYIVPLMVGLLPLIGGLAVVTDYSYKY